MRPNFETASRSVLNFSINGYILLLGIIEFLRFLQHIGSFGARDNSHSVFVRNNDVVRV